MSAWKRFTSKNTVNEPKASIWKSSLSIGLNAECIRRFDLGQYEYAVLWYNKEKGMIGIQLTEESGGGAYKFIEHQSAVSISAKAFIRRYELTDITGKTFKVEKADDESCLDFLIVGVN